MPLRGTRSRMTWVAGAGENSKAGAHPHRQRLRHRGMDPRTEAGMTAEGGQRPGRPTVEGRKSRAHGRHADPSAGQCLVRGYGLRNHRMMIFYVYILASRKRGTLYVGVTNDLGRRVWEHREKLNDGFTKRYGVTQLVYYEVFDCVNDAIAREKRLKRWPRAWKIRTIERDNPDWHDLYEDLNR